MKTNSNLQIETAEELPNYGSFFHTSDFIKNISSEFGRIIYTLNIIFNYIVSGGAFTISILAAIPWLTKSIGLLVNIFNAIKYATTSENQNKLENPKDKRISITGLIVSVGLTIASFVTSWVYLPVLVMLTDVTEKFSFFMDAIFFRIRLSKEKQSRERLVSNLKVKVEKMKDQALNIENQEKHIGGILHLKSIIDETEKELLDLKEQTLKANNSIIVTGESFFNSAFALIGVTTLAVLKGFAIVGTIATAPKWLLPAGVVFLTATACYGISVEVCKRFNFTPLKLAVDYINDKLNQFTNKQIDTPKDQLVLENKNQLIEKSKITLTSISTHQEDKSLLKLVPSQEPSTLIFSSSQANINKVLEESKTPPCTSPLATCKSDLFVNTQLPHAESTTKEESRALQTTSLKLFQESLEPKLNKLKQLKPKKFIPERCVSPAPTRDNLPSRNFPGLLRRRSE